MGELPHREAVDRCLQLADWLRERGFETAAAKVKHAANLIYAPTAAAPTVVVDEPERRAAASQ